MPRPIGFTVTTIDDAEAPDERSDLAPDPTTSASLPHSNPAYPDSVRDASGTRTPDQGDVDQARTDPTAPIPHKDVQTSESHTYPTGVLTERERALLEVTRSDMLWAANVEISGPIPAADELAKYTPDQQERIMRGYEATTTDESARRTAVVDAQIELAKKSIWVTPAVWGGSMVAALVAEGVFNSTPLAITFVGAAVARSVFGWAASYSLSRRNSDDEES
jgi:hypothetical protein